MRRREIILCCLCLLLGITFRIIAQDFGVINNAGGPIQGLQSFNAQAGGATQYIQAPGLASYQNFNIAAGNFTAAGSIQVVNADFVDVAFLGFNGTASAVSCGTSDPYPCNAVWLTATRTDNTHVTVTANRFSIGDGTTGTNVSFVVTDITSILVDSVQRGTVSSGAAVAVTACPSSSTFPRAYGLTFLGISGVNLGGYIQMQDSTHISSVNGTGVSTGWQLICYKRAP